MTDNQNLFWNYYTLLSSPSVLLNLIVCTVTAILPDLILKVKENSNVEKLTEKLRLIDSKVRDRIL